MPRKPRTSRCSDPAEPIGRTRRHRVEGRGLARHDGATRGGIVPPSPAGEDPWPAFIESARVPMQFLIELPPC